MRAIRITVDQSLLARLDADPEVKKDGRSAVFRRALELYLGEQHRRRIDDAYSRASGKGSSVEAEFAGWPEEGWWHER